MIPGAENPVRIAFCITDLDVGGAERALVRIVTGLDRSRWDPTVFCLSREGALANVLREAGVPVTCFGVNGGRDLSVVWKLRKELLRVRPALLQTFLYHANIVGRLAGTAARVPVIVSGIRVSEKRSRLRLWVDRATESLVDAHVCVSRDVAQFSIDTGRLSPKKVHVIGNGVDAAAYACAQPFDLATLGIPPGSQTILYVGRLDSQKRPLFLLDAAGPLLRERPNLHLLYVGDGPERTELIASSERDFASQVHVVGRRNDVPSLMRSATLFVLSSLWEGQPNVVLEAMAAGLPVVATRVEGVSDLIADGESGLIVPADSPTGLTEALRKMLDQPSLAQGLAAAAQHAVCEWFTWDGVVSHYDRLYAELLQK